jgi:hypothetical protein
MSNRTKDMSKDSTQNIPQEATKLKKLAKATARYMEMEEFKDSLQLFIDFSRPCLHHLSL